MEIWTVLGIIAFILYYFYDLNIVFFHTKIGTKCFIAGTLLLSVATIGLIKSFIWSIPLTVMTVAWGAIAVGFFFVLIYTLFFALPVKEAYDGELVEGKKTFTEGMYALCRHPGMLWFAGFYFSLAFAGRDMQMYISAFIFSALDFFYILLQDMLIFPKQFYDYDVYKITTPFLIPNKNSITRAIHTLRKG